MKNKFLSMLFASSLMMTNSAPSAEAAQEGKDEKVNAKPSVGQVDYSRIIKEGELSKLRGEILYIDDSEAGKTYLTTMKPDGSGKKHLTPAFFNISFPRYNKESGWIGFTNKTEDMKSEIYVMNKNKVKRMLIGANLEDFSPDGKSILYTTADEKAELYVYNIKKQIKVKISQDYKVLSARWSPNGSWIVASIMTDDGSTDLVLISTLGQGIKRLCRTPYISESFPAFVEKNFIVYNANAEGMYSVEFLEVGDPPIVYRTGVKGLFPVMSVDNDWIAYESEGKIMVAYKTGKKSKALAKGKTPLWIERTDENKAKKATNKSKTTQK